MLTGGSYALGALAGILSTLSPCVLPLLPIVLGVAATAHRFGPVTLAGGVALSFVAIGLFVATIGFGIGLDSDLFRIASAVLMLSIGVLLLSETLQQRLAVAGTGLGDAAGGFMERISPEGWQGQLLLGLLLGAVWAPCVGPTLGAASALAAGRDGLGQVALVMVLFGLGAALPLLLIGILSREVLTRWRSRIIGVGRAGKIALGGMLLVVGVAVMTGLDKRLEAVLVEASPAWLTDLTVRF